MNLSHQFQDLIDKIEKPAKLGGFLLTLASMIWFLLMLRVAKNELHLVVWVEKDTMVYPSDKSVNESLPLNFGETAAKSVRVLSVRISNYGNSMIGKQESTWTLTLASADGTPVAVVGDPIKSPESLVFHQLDREKLNTLTFKIGALERKATIELKVMLLNSRNSKTGGLTVTQTLDGLPYEIAPRSPADRIFDQIMQPVAIVIGLALMLVVWRPLRDEARSRTRPKDLEELAQKRAHSAWEKSGSPIQTKEEQERQFLDAQNAILAETPFVWSFGWRLVAFFGIGLVVGAFVARGISYVVGWIQSLT